MNKITTEMSAISLNITDGTHSTVKDNPQGEYYLLSCKNIKDGRIIINSKDRKIDKQTLKKLNSRTKLAKNDLLLTTVGTIGEVALVKSDNINFELQRSVAIIKPNINIVFPKFLYYYVKSNSCQNQLEGLSRGTAQKCLFLEPINKIIISYPESKIIQKKIATILSNYDDLIENNIRRIQILEQIARLVYDEWFVKFKFHGHENVKIVDSELGKIPLDWSVKKLDELCSKVTDGTHDTPKPSLQGYPLVTGKHIKNGFIDFTKCYKISPEDHKEVMKRSKPENGDIIYPNIGTLGNAVLVDEGFEFSIKNVALFKPKNRNLSSYLFLFFSSKITFNRLVWTEPLLVYK